ncbi:MAG: diaminopimelate decarboxylase [Nitrospirae bacterium GWC2_57_13]|jgi:diaminopimelate decarboxylase|nr:MAG: diaminopimelate decarboxylase [Nitrospirae bacterium GWC2_57_13]HAS53093.1 diaminopimelate decarboxylase [Nitrospiraceae bacterium]
MHDFVYKNNELYCEDVAVRAIAQRVGTPFYLYSSNTLLNHIRAFKNAFNGAPHLICYALKANPNGTVLRLLGREGAGADIVSGGDLFRALRAGIDPGKIVYAGVGKRRDEIEYALKMSILMFNVESGEELLAIDRAAGEMRCKAPIALRVNPDIDPRTHAYISTGMKENKFGIPFEQALEYYQTAKDLPNVEVVGVHQHIGSQITEVRPFVDALGKLLGFVRNLRAAGIEIKYLNIGGGLGITYKDETPPNPQELADAIRPLLEQAGCTLILEPGRAITGNAGILVTRALYHKKTKDKNFLIVDAGMNDLIRPSLYEAYHEIKPVIETDSDDHEAFDVVGPICESGDFFAKNRRLAAVNQGDLLAIMGAGAYGFSMSSNYNSRPRVAEVMVKGSEFFTIRERENYDELIRGEKVPRWLD